MGKGQMGKSSESEGKVWGRGEHANMPKEVKMDAYPKAIEYGPSMEDDTMTRVDEENRRSDSRARSHVSNQH